MTDPNTQLPNLPAASLINDSDLWHTRQGATDKKATIQQLKDAFGPEDVDAVPLTRSINTNGPLTGGGDLSGNITLDINQASTTTDGSVRLATGAETQGTSSSIAVTPKGLSARLATEVLAGLVEKATDVEAAGGIDTDRYINAKQLQDKFDGIDSATTTREGLVRIANVTEATSLTSDTVAMSPLKMANAFSGSKAANGYMKLPNGWIIQWGRTSGRSTEGTGTTIFPITFPNAIFQVIIGTETANSVPADGWVQLYSKNTSGFSWRLQGYRAGLNNTHYGNWFAIGY